MARRDPKAPENFFGLTDPVALDRVAGRLALHRLGQLEDSTPLTEFTRASLLEVHRFLLQDVYPWAGQVRTTEVGAMGMMMCRAEYVEDELARVMRGIARRPPSRDDKAEAVRTVADHWCELTIVHPFRDGNSRTQRYFFDQMLRSAGWIVDWTGVNSAHAHAARYVGAATADPSYLAQILLPAVYRPDAIPNSSYRSLANTQGNRASNSAEVFQQMMKFRRSNPGEPWVPEA